MMEMESCFKAAVESWPLGKKKKNMYRKQPLGWQKFCPRIEEGFTQSLHYDGLKNDASMLSPSQKGETEEICHEKFIMEPWKALGASNHLFCFSPCLLKRARIWEYAYEACILIIICRDLTQHTKIKRSIVFKNDNKNIHLLRRFIRESIEKSACEWTHSWNLAFCFPFSVSCCPRKRQPFCFKSQLDLSDERFWLKLQIHILVPFQKPYKPKISREQTS